MDFVTFDIAKKLKEKGFKEKCFAYYFPKGSELCFNKNPFRGGIVEDCLYSNNALPVECVASDFIDSPTVSQVLWWLREEKGLYVDISLYKKGYSTLIYETNFPSDKDYANTWRINNVGNTYEEAALDGIKYALDNLI